MNRFWIEWIYFWNWAHSEVLECGLECGLTLPNLGVIVNELTSLVDSVYKSARIDFPILKWIRWWLRNCRVFSNITGYYEWWFCFFEHFFRTSVGVHTSKSFSHVGIETVEKGRIVVGGKQNVFDLQWQCVRFCISIVSALSRQQ